LRNTAQYGEKDQVWFPKWLARYAAGKALTAGLLPVTEALVIEFSRSLLKSGTPAWQRLQGVRSVEAYRDLVLNVSEPDLMEMKQILGRLAAAEKDSGAAAGNPEIADQQRLIGVIDRWEPQILQSMRKELRLRHLALETERAYIGWIVRFIRHCGWAELQAFGTCHGGWHFRCSFVGFCCHNCQPIAADRRSKSFTKTQMEPVLCHSSQTRPVAGSTSRAILLCISRRSR